MKSRQLFIIIENRTKLNKGDLRDLVKYGAYYCIGLLSYYLYGLLSIPATTGNGANIAIVISFVAGGIVFGLAAKRFRLSQLMKYSIIIMSLGCFIVSLYLFLYPKYVEDTCLLIRLGRLILSFGFSAGFGLSVTMVVENLYRYKRTWATAIVCGIGFFGPILAVVLIYITGGLLKSSSQAGCLSFLAVCCVNILLIIGEFKWVIRCFKQYPNFQARLLLWGKIPEESPLREINRDALYKKAFWRYLFEFYPKQKTIWKKLPKFLKDFFTFVTYITTAIDVNKNQRRKTAFTFWNTLSMGIGVQFCFYLVSRASSFNLYNLFDKFNLLNFDEHNSTNCVAILFRALGVIIGTFYVAYISKKNSQRRNILMYFQFLQAISIFCFFFPVFHEQVFQEYSRLWQQIYFCAASTLLGFSNGIWFLIFLQAAEQVPLKYRPTVLVIMPNIYRFSTLILIIYQVELDTNPLVLFICGMFFIALSLSGTFNIRDNFEGDALIVDEDGNKSLFSTELNHKIAEIDEGNIISEDIQLYLEQINDILFADFKKTLGNHFFINNIFYFDKHNSKDLGTALSKDTRYNKQAYEQYQIHFDKPKEFHRIARAYVNKGYCTSLSKYAVENTYISGILLWRSAPNQKLNADENPEYRPSPKHYSYAELDLSSIIIKDIDAYRKLITDDLPDDEVNMLLDKLVDNADFSLLNQSRKISRTFEEIFKTQNKSLEEINKLKANILLHRLDSEDYPIGGYYAYFLKPSAASPDLKGLLFLKTVIPLKRLRLGQLRDLISVIMLQRANASLYRSNAHIIDEDCHSKRHELSYLNEKIKDLDILLQDPLRRKGQIENHKKIIKSVTNHISRITNINYFLMKYPPVNRIYPGHRDWAFFQNEKISLRNELLEVISIILETLALLNITSTEHKKKIAEGLRGLREKIETEFDEHIKIRTLEPMFHVIVAEMIKNSAFYTDSQNPSMDIKFIQNIHGNYELHFYNNRCISQAAYDYIQKGIEKIGKNDDGLDGRTRGGIRTIKRYIKTPYLNHDCAENWTLTVNKTSLFENMTDIYLTIPSEDVKKHPVLKTDK